MMKQRCATGILVCALLLPAGSSVAAEGEACVSRKLISRVMPQYPEDLRLFGNNGSVTVVMTATPEGSVRDLELKESSHPSFERATVTALLQWRMEPIPADATQYCKTFAQRFDYQLRSPELPDDFPTPFRLSAAELSTLPEELRYDTPAEVRLALPVVYPYELLRDAIEGEATVVFVIDPEGRVQKTRITAASHEAFGRALEASLTAWMFKPATRNGEPSWAAAKYTRKFEQEERDFAFDVERPVLLREVARKDSSIPLVAALDRPPKVLYRPLPILDRAQSYEKESVRLEFIVDKSGFVRYAHALQAKDQRLAWSAITAVSRWQFEPPIKDGKAVDVRVTMAMQF